MSKELPQKTMNTTKGMILENEFDIPHQKNS